VLPVLGEMAIQVGEFEKGAAYYEEFGRRFPRDKAAGDLLLGAAELRMELGDRAGAMTLLERLASSMEPARRGEVQLKAARAAFEARSWRRAAELASALFGDKARAVRPSSMPEM
jgi:hypothetical protein